MCVCVVRKPSLINLITHFVTHVHHIEKISHFYSFVFVFLVSSLEVEKYYCETPQGMLLSFAAAHFLCVDFLSLSLFVSRVYFVVIAATSSLRRMPQRKESTTSRQWLSMTFPRKRSRPVAINVLQQNVLATMQHPINCITRRVLITFEFVCQ